MMDPHGYIDPTRPLELLLTRHPETVANLQRRFVGQVEVPLSGNGEQQRRRAVDGIVAWRPERIISSPMERCLGIAQPAADRLGIEVEVHPHLIEMNFGAIENLTAREVIDHGLCFPWGDTRDRWPVDGAESMEAFMARTALEARTLSSLSGRVSVVSHGGAIRGLLSAWIGIEEEHFWQLSVPNVSSCMLEFDADGNAYLTALGLDPEQVAVSRQVRSRVSEG